MKNLDQSNQSLGRVLNQRPASLDHDAGQSHKAHLYFFI
jgi:hypothetical protein